VHVTYNCYINLCIKQRRREMELNNAYKLHLLSASRKNEDCCLSPWMTDHLHPQLP
jgi:hypothetical protein